MPGIFLIQLDVTIVNVALPAIQRDIGGSLAGLQWVVDGYTLGSLLASSGASGAGPGQAPTLHAALAVAAIGYVIAVALAWFAIRPASSSAGGGAGRQARWSRRSSPTY